MHKFFNTYIKLPHIRMLNESNEFENVKFSRLLILNDYTFQKLYQWNHLENVFHRFSSNLHFCWIRYPSLVTLETESASKYPHSGVVHSILACSRVREKISTENEAAKFPFQLSSERSRTQIHAQFNSRELSGVIEDSLKGCTHMLKCFSTAHINACFLAYLLKTNSPNIGE